MMLLVLSISESSQVGEARRQAMMLASHLGFDETETGKGCYCCYRSG